MAGMKWESQFLDFQTPSLPLALASHLTAEAPRIPDTQQTHCLSWKRHIQCPGQGKRWPQTPGSTLFPVPGLSDFERSLVCSPAQGQGVWSLLRAVLSRLFNLLCFLFLICKISLITVLTICGKILKRWEYQTTLPAS